MTDRGHGAGLASFRSWGRTGRMRAQPHTSSSARGVLGSTSSTRTDPVIVPNIISGGEQRTLTRGRTTMADGTVLPPGTGRRISGAGMTLKVGSEQSARWSAFEAEVGPGFDVGAHRHAEAEEIFYILEGELDLLAFEPRIRTSGDWTAWESADGAKVSRGGPGSLMFVPAGCPHPSPTRGPRPPGCCSWSRRPATNSTWKASRSCSAARGRRISPRSSPCAPGTTSSSSHP